MSVVQKKWVWGIGGCTLALWLLLQVSAIFFHVGDGAMRYVSRLILPPAWISSSPISYHRVVETAHAFVALRIASTYQEAFPLALDFVLRDVRMKDLLEGIEVSEEKIFTEADTALLFTHGISEKEWREYIQDSLLRARTAELLRNAMLPSQEMRLQNVLEKIQLGMPFSDIARYFSEDSSAMNGGDLGVFLVSELPAWAQDIANMEINEVRSDFVGTDAFWVLKVVDAGGADDKAWVHIQGVAINKPTVGAVLRGHAAKHPARIFVW